MATGVTTKIVVDKRRKTKDSLYPIRIRIIYNRECRHYSLPDKKYLSEEDFNRIKTENVKGDDKKLLLYFNKQEIRVREIIEHMPFFDFAAFEKQLNGPVIDKTSFYDIFKTYIDNLKEQKRIGTAESYSSSLSKLKSFKTSLHLHELTPEFLQKFEDSQLKAEKSSTTIGIYARNIRAVYNYCISAGFIGRDLYPFGRGKYEIPAGKNTKKALSKTELKKIIDYAPTPLSMEEFSRDIWLFSYLSNGMNVNDIARLKYRNIVDGNCIVFIRQKTRRTKKQNQKLIKAYLTDLSKKIIEKHGNEVLPDNYIFDILKPGMTEEKIYTTIHQTVKNINYNTRKIAKKVDIEKDVTTYTARHSFSTVMKRAGASLEIISESLGHHDLKTTENYLDSFEDETLIKYSENLTKFD